MMFNLLIILDDDEDNHLELSPYSGNEDYLIIVYANNKVSYEEIISNQEYFEQMKVDFESMYGLDMENRKFFNNAIASYGEIKPFLRNFTSLEINGEPSDISKFIDNNPIFRDKKIIDNELMPLKREVFDNVNACLGDKTNIKFLVEGNNDPITLEEYKKTIDEIEKIAKNVRILNLSPLEEIMLVYDIVREREYLLEDVEDSYSVSRDLTSVLFGEKIVCVGYTVYFNAILRFLGYNAMNFKLLPSEGKNAHMRSLVYVHDEKYNINGMYFFDPTFDSKKGDNSFLKKYRFFARTYEQIRDADNGKYVCEYYKYMDSEKMMELEELLGEELSFIDLVKIVGISKVNKLFRMAGLEEVSLDNVDIMLKAFGGSLKKDDVFDRIYELTMLANSPINYEVFLGVLYNVRKQQYYANPEKYALDMNSITDILIKSKVVDKPDSDEKRLLTAILGTDFIVNKYNAKDKVLEYFQSNGLDKDMERIRLLRTLKTVYNKKINEEKRLIFKN